MDAARVRVLIVDDQAVFADALRLFLERDERLEIVGTASDGATAIDLAVMNRADVVLMDVAMPRMGGLEATQKLLTIHPDARVLILSGIAQDGIEDEARAAGAEGFLLKGGLEHEIVDRILALAPPRLQ